MFLIDFFNEWRARKILLAKKGTSSNPPSIMEGDLDMNGYDVLNIDDLTASKIKSPELRATSLHHLITGNQLIVFKENHSELTANLKVLYQHKIIFQSNPNYSTPREFELKDVSSTTNGYAIQLVQTGTTGTGNETLAIGHIGTSESNGGNLRIRNLKSPRGTNIIILNSDNSETPTTFTSTFPSPLRFNGILTFKNKINLENSLRDSALNDRIRLKPNPISTDGHIELYGRTKIDNLLIPKGAGLNKVLTSDALGNASWQTLPSASQNLSSVCEIGNTTPTDIEITDNTKGIILKSPDNGRWRITIDNDGSLITIKL